MIRLLIDPDDIQACYAETDRGVYPHYLSHLKYLYQSGDFTLADLEKHLDENSSPAATLLEDILSSGYEYQDVQQLDAP